MHFSVDLEKVRSLVFSNPFAEMVVLTFFIEATADLVCSIIRPLKHLEAAQFLLSPRNKGELPQLPQSRASENGAGGCQGDRGLSRAGYPAETSTDAVVWQPEYEHDDAETQQKEKEKTVKTPKQRKNKQDEGRQRGPSGPRRCRSVRGCVCWSQQALTDQYVSK